MDSALSRVLTLERIRRLAGTTSFARGQAYHAEQRVTSLVGRGDTLTATVTGAEDYAVRFEATSAGEDRFTYRCSCPVGADGAFCKHGVAVALAWLASGHHADDNTPTKHRRRADSSTPLVRLDDVRPWLLEQPPAALADLLLDVAERDTQLREKLLRAAARATDRSVDLSDYRRVLERATRAAGFIDYRAAGDYADGVRAAMDSLRGLLADLPDQAGAVIELVEDALHRVEQTLESADDSDGEIGGLLGELQELHLAACRVAKPNPEELARRLFTWEIHGNWDVFYGAAHTYADVLGDAGLAVYRSLAEAAWERVPALAPGEGAAFDGTRFRVASIMESLVRATGGDVDALAAIKAKDLSHASGFLAIAQLYHGAERWDDALAWAQRGLEAFPKDTDEGLLEFLAAEYHRRGRHSDAMELVWQRFESRPTLETFQNLSAHATIADDGSWSAWRERALALLRQRVAQPAAAVQSRFWSTDAASSAALVEIFLWENDPEAAWLEAQNGYCGGALLLRVAAARALTHPADAIPIYQQHAEALIGQKNNRAYDEAARYLKQIKALHLALGQPQAWASVRARLSVEHKAKRNFMALLAQI